MIPKEADVVIVGGGVIGSSIAYFLSRSGKDVVLLEKGEVTGEATAANGAFVWTSTRRPGIDLDLALASIEIHQALHEELDIDNEYRRSGGMIIIENDHQIPAMEAFHRERQAAGLQMEMLEGKEARKLEPFLSERIAGALYNPLDGGINPFHLVAGLQQKVEEMGSRVLLHTAVRDIEMENGRVKAVVSNRGTIRTDVVVNACGAWASLIGDMVGIKVPILPYEMGMIVTEQMPSAISHVMEGATYVTEEYSKEEMMRDRKKFGCSLVIHQTVSGNILLGATWHYVGYDKRLTYEEMIAIAKEGAGLFPFLEDCHVIRSFANFFPFTSDDLPILGYVEEVEGFVMAAGHCGHGVCLGPITGKLITELICEGQPSMPLDELSLSRFS